MSYFTQILSQIESGDPQAESQLTPLIYDELCEIAAQKMATERKDRTVQGTALVHEAYRRLVDSPNGNDWSLRGRFFTAAAEAMRRILVEQAGWRGAEEGGGNAHEVQVETLVIEIALPLKEMLEFNSALSQLEEADPLAAKIVKLRIFAGLTIEDAAAVLGVPAREVSRDWSFAEAWLFRAMQENVD